MNDFAYIICYGNGKYVAIDAASGGYPYESNIWDCKKFATYQGAKEYRNVCGMNYLDIRKISIKFEEIENE